MKSLLLRPGHFYGQKQRSHEIASARLTETFYSPSFTIPRHAHEQAFFGFVLEGAYSETYERRNRECLPSTLLFHPEGEIHSEAHEDTVVRIFSVEPASDILEHVRERSNQLRQPIESRGGALVGVTARLYREFREQDTLTPLAMEALVLELLITACRTTMDTNTGTPPAWLREVRDLLHDQFLDNLSLKEIGERVGIHPAHLARAFRQYYHCTVGDYVRSLRMEKARLELASTETPLSVLALSLGYSDQSHFATAFRRHTGIPPGQYRKMTRGR